MRNPPVFRKSDYLLSCDCMLASVEDEDEQEIVDHKGRVNTLTFSDLFEGDLTDCEEMV